MNHRFCRGDQKELADAALTEILDGRPADYAVYDAGNVHVYDPETGVYDVCEDYEVRNRVASFAGSEIDPAYRSGKKESACIKVNAATTSGAYSILCDSLRASGKGRPTFDTAAKGLCFGNGFVTVERGEIKIGEHSPDNMARHRYGFDYVPGRAPVAFLAFLDSLFRDCSEAERRDRIALIQEYIGVSLIGQATRYNRALVVYATGGNGKSELMHIIRGVFPEGSTSSLPPHEWSHNFRRMMLEGKLINLVDEMPSDELASGESFKTIITGGTVVSERKNRDPVEFRPIAGHVFNANQPIRSGDHSDGFWRRPLVLPLTRVFENADYKSDDLERGIGDRVLRESIETIVPWALEGAARVQRRGVYTEPASSAAYVREWREGSDQVLAYLAEYPITARLSASTVYRQYVEWAKERGNRTVNATNFGERLCQTGRVRKVKNSIIYYEPAKDPAEVAEREAIEARAARAARTAPAEPPAEQLSHAPASDAAPESYPTPAKVLGYLDPPADYADSYADAGESYHAAAAPYPAEDHAPAAAE